MDKNEIRKRIYKDLITVWKKNDYKGFSRISVGAGKTKMFIDIIKQHINEVKNPKVIILVPTRVLRDKTFTNEVEKWWNIEEFDKYCKLVTYQAQMNVVNESYTLGLFDEADTMLSDRHIDGFKNNVYDKYLALSGTYTQNKLEYALPIWSKMMYDYPMLKAQQEGLINNTKIYIHLIPLDKQNNIVQKNGRRWSENTKYTWVNNKIDNARKTAFAALSERDGLYQKLESTEVDLETKTTYSERIGELKQIIKKAFKEKEQFESGFGSSRMIMLYTLKSLESYAVRLLNHLKKKTDNKVLVFAKRTDTLDSICGKNVYYKTIKDDILDDFNEGKIQYLGVSKKIERGFNFENLNHAIFHSYSSSESELAQKIGRIVRLETTKTGFIHILASYYVENDKELMCQNFNWATYAIDALGFNYELLKR